MNRLNHAMSVDVEDWTNAAALWVAGRVTPPTDRVVRNTERLVDLFAEFDVRATWFVLGEVAETFPRLVRRLADAGHETGVHGHHHHRIHELSPAAYRESILRAKAAVEDASGRRVRGYRAVAMSLTRDTWWAWDTLVEAGFEYSSSLFPTRLARHSMPDAPIAPGFVTAPGGGTILEIPLTVVPFAGIRLPAAGGGYLRHLPYWYTRWALRRLERSGRAAIAYLHPYEIDTAPPPAAFLETLDSDTRSRILDLVPSQYRNRQHTRAKLRQMMRDFEWRSLESVFGEHLNTSPAAGG